MNVIGTYVSFIRFPNCLIAAAAVAVGQYLSPATSASPLDPFAMAAAFFVCAFGNIINDIRDLDADRINHPDRALPSGTISLSRARTLSFLFLIMALLATMALTWLGKLLVVSATVLVIWYNLHLKHTAYWGNLVVSVLGAMAFLLGAAAGGIKALVELPGPLIPAGFAVIMHFGREVIKDIQDRAGDAAAGSRTAPIRSGSAVPLAVVYTAFALVIMLSAAVYLRGWFNRRFFYIVLFFIWLPLVVQSAWLRFSPEPARCRIISGIIKIQMVAGIIALVIGKDY